jgi:F-type H+-transporting ATPase subunit gamma
MDASPLASTVLFHLGPVAITRPVVTTWAIMLVLTLGSWLVTRRLTPHPDRRQAVLEIVVTGILGQIEDVVRKNARPLLPLLGTLFIFLVAANLSGILPGTKAPTAKIETPAALALIVFFSVHYFGVRAQGLLERGRSASWTHPMATRCAAAPETIQRLSAELYRRIARGEIARVEVIYARYRQGGAASIERRLLLPLDLASLKAKQSLQPPLHNLTPVALHERLMAEYVFALLTEAAVESIASENAARLAAMESAHENVSKKLEQLHQNARQARQSEITTELLELVTGAQALARNRS